MGADVALEVIAAVVALFAAPIAATVTWRLSRRKHTAEAESTVAQGANMAVETMLRVMEELRREVADLTQEAELLRKENKILHEEVVRLRTIVNNLGGTQ